MKEITYKHAEGFASGELKHGPLALVEDTTPVFALVTGNDEAPHKTVVNVKEVEAREAPVIAITPSVGHDSQSGYSRFWSVDQVW
jgi:glucosamine--fructose-6-phosphate aminotransferase (isomerizing)